MPYFKLKGKPILPNNVDCPVEVVSNNVVTPTSSFFENWINYYNPDRIKFDGETFTFVGGGGYEITACRIGCTPNVDNTISFKVTGVQIYGNGYDGNPSRLTIGIRQSPPDKNGNLDYLVSTEVKSTREISLTFNPGNYTSIYLVLNGGYLDAAYTHKFTFNFNGIRKGMVRITDVTDSGYHLVAPNGASDIPALNTQDVFEGKLKINGQAQQYCYRGFAPRGILLLNTQAGHSIDMDKNGQIRLRPHGHEQDTFLISTIENPRHVLTFVLQGGGGGGGQGTSGFGWKGGAGGGSGGLVVCTFQFKTSDITGDGWHEVAYFSVGGGGAGGTSNFGGNGGDTTLVIWDTPGQIGGSPNHKFIAYGGKGGGGDHGATAGAGGSVFGDTACRGYLASQGWNGAAGGIHASVGNNFNAGSSYVYSINSTRINWSAHSGGSTGGGSAGGGGGASYASNGGAGGGNPGGSGNRGSGGGGGGSNLTSEETGGAGGVGVVEIWY